MRFFNEKSSNPQKSIKLLWLFAICTLPGLAALLVATYVALYPEKLKFAFLCNLILVLVNIALVIAGRIYRKNHPLDDATAEKLNEKQLKEKEHGRKSRAKSIIVYSLIGALFLGILLFFMMGISGITVSTISAVSADSNINPCCSDNTSE